MDLEEHTGVEQVKEHCESCGAKLTPAEIETLTRLLMRLETTAGRLSGETPLG